MFGVGVAVTFGLLVAWAVHDLEEVAERVWQRLGSIDGREFAAATAGTHLMARRLPPWGP